ncbi:hypothetical protein E2C01_066681 [Portunus trituberculatus]|uniref:Uncharacterized protein n=1 Tax=Portunus trituberculatus TaxID=210409 RepID=A0A5B7HT00_PORTR|nr:hypothetical protein [Portunus trituberculatus]
MPVRGVCAGYEHTATHTHSPPDNTSPPPTPRNTCTTPLSPHTHATPPRPAHHCNTWAAPLPPPR